MVEDSIAEVVFSKLNRERRFKLIYTDQYRSDLIIRESGLLRGYSLNQNNYNAPEDAIVIDAFDDSKTHSFCVLISHPSFKKVPLDRDIPSIRERKIEPKIDKKN